MKRLKIKEVLAGGEVGQQVLVKGWVRTKRGSKNVNFIALNDGSTINNLQVVADVEKFGESLLTPWMVVRLANWNMKISMQPWLR